MQTSTCSPKKVRLGLWIPRIFAVLAFTATLSIVFVSSEPAGAGVSDLSVSAFGTKGNGVTDDAAAFQATMNAASSGSTVFVPPATYRIGSTVKLKSGVTLWGPGATLYMPAGSSTTVLLNVDGTSGTEIVGLRLSSDVVSPNSNVIGIGALSKGASDLTVRDLATENLKYGMKLGSSGISYRLTVQNWVGRGDSQNLYLGNVKSGTLTDLDLDARNYTTHEHSIYLEKGNTDLVFDRVRLSGGYGYSLQLYGDRPQRPTEASASPSVTCGWTRPTRGSWLSATTG